MRQITLFVLTCAVAFVLAYIFTMPREGRFPPPESRVVEPVENEAPQEQPEKNRATADGQTTGRLIAPPVAPAPIAPAQQDTRTVTPDAPLERVEPRQPLSEIAQPQKRFQPELNAVAVDDAAEFALLPRPVAVSAGVIQIGENTLVMSGIDVVGPEEKCAVGGESWPCGMQARTAFRSWLRSRSLSCRMPQTPADSVVRTDCKLAGTDVSEWLVDNGWARAVSDGPYAERGKRAEEERRGIFGEPPRSLPPSEPVLTPTFDPQQPQLEPAPLEPVPSIDPSGAFPPAPEPRN